MLFCIMQDSYNGGNMRFLHSSGFQDYSRLQIVRSSILGRLYVRRAGGLNCPFPPVLVAMWCEELTDY